MRSMNSAIKVDRPFAARIGSEFFSWDKSRMEFSADASVLGRHGKSFTCVTDEDADADKGFVMVSEKTGSEVLWILHDTERDREGDIAGWLFRISVLSLRAHPHLKGAVVFVIND